MQQLCKLFGLSHRDRQLLINAFILLLLIRFGLWLLPFQQLQKVLDLIDADKADQPSRHATGLGKIVTAVNISSRYTPGGAKCLARALTTQSLMKQQGYTPQLRLGVAKGTQGTFEAHAWVEHQGQIVIGYLTDLSRFKPLLALDGGQR